MPGMKRYIFRMFIVLPVVKHVKWSEATQSIIDKKTPSCNTKAEYAELRAVMNEKGREVLHLETKETGVVSYSFWHIFLWLL